MPNLLLDRLMPDLKDTELRVLLVVLRQTVGWNRPNRAVVLSFRRLKSLTGRHSEAISKALSSLQAKGLIHTPSHRTVRFSKEAVPKSEQQ